MSYKPSDLFLSAIDIFAIFFPGAVFIFLRLEIWTNGFEKLLDIDTKGGEFWVAFVVAAYLLGHIFKGIGRYINKLHNRFRGQAGRNDTLYNYVIDSIKIAPDEIVERNNVFYRAFSYIRINSLSALAEIERETADYKLFRSLATIFLVDAIISLFFQEWLRTILVLILFIFSLRRFWYLRNRAETITFELYLLLKAQETKKSDPA